MMLTYKKNLLLSLLSMLPILVKAQPSVQDCIGAIPICQSKFFQSTPYYGTGKINESGKLLNTCMDYAGGGEVNSVWYKFTVQVSGTLSFLIQPNSSSDDYDWILFNLTNATCDDINQHVVSCNSVGNTNVGETGMSSAKGGVNDKEGPSNGPSFQNKYNRSISVTVGETYYLMIENWSNGSGYTLDFSSSQASIFDNIKPVLQPLGTVACGATTLVLNFDEDIKCNTVTLADFTLSGPGSTYTITNINSVCNSATTSSTTYTVTVSPAIQNSGTYSFCLVNASGSVTDFCDNPAEPQCFTFSPCVPPVLAVNATGTDICQGSTGNIIASAMNGTPPYTYTWSPGGGLSSTTGTPVAASPSVTTTYTVTVKDNTGATATTTVVVTVKSNPVVSVLPITICAGSSATLTASGADTYTWSPASGLSSGIGVSVIAAPTATSTYTVCGTTNGCSACTSVVVTVNPNPVVSVPGTSICPGGSIVLTASGADSYTWSPATGLSTTTGVSVTANPGASTTYTICGTSLGCSSCTTTSVFVGALVADAGPDKFICSGGSTTLNATGGSIFSWTPAIGLSSTTVNSPTANPSVTTTYTVVVSDGSCSDDDIVIVTVDPPVSLNVTPVHVACFGTCNGQTSVIPSGGTSPYTYAWSNGCSLAACNNICAGTYTLMATDALGCTASGATTVKEPTALTVVLTGSSNVSCFGLCDGTAGVSANGGTAPYSYAWIPGGGTAANVTGLCSGTFTCTITDANNCSVKTFVTITQPAKVIVTSSNASICLNDCAAITAMGSGGTGTISLSWNPNTVSICPAVTTTYTITGTDTKGCTGEATSVVTVNPAPVIYVPAATLCEGTYTTLNASGASIYTWSPSTGLSSTNGTTIIASPVATSTYTVSGTSSKGCTASTSVIVTVNPKPVLSIKEGDACPGDSILLSVSGANTYSWSPSFGLSSSTGSTVIATPASTTVYTVTATGINGCTSITTVKATVNPKPVAAFTTSPDVVDEFDPTVHFTDVSTGGTINSWIWNFGDTGNAFSFAQNPVFVYPRVSNTYQVHLIVTNQFGCMDSTIATVFIHGVFTFYIPNAFTPNGDDINDTFGGKGTGIKDYVMYIYDRWGNLLFQSNSINEQWDGKVKGGPIVQQDVYVYHIIIREESGKEHHYTGTVSVVK